MDATVRIKNLSIALAALSSINTSRSHEHSQDIEGLLAEAIRQAQKEQGPYKPAQPAEPTVFETAPF